MKSIIAIAAALAALSSAPVLAREPGPSRAVRTADLDLATPSGQRALNLRVLHAATEMCGTPSSADPLGKRKVAACRDAARAEAATRSAQLIARARVAAGAVALADPR